MNVNVNEMNISFSLFFIFYFLLKNDIVARDSVQLNRELDGRAKVRLAQWFKRLNGAF